MPQVVFLGAVGEVFEFEAGAVLAGAGHVDGLGGVEGFFSFAAVALPPSLSIIDFSAVRISGMNSRGVVGPPNTALFWYTWSRPTPSISRSSSFLSVPSPRTLPDPGPSCTAIEVSNSISIALSNREKLIPS